MRRSMPRKGATIADRAPESPGHGLEHRSARLQRLHSGGVRDRTELAQVSKSYPCPATANISSPAAIQTTTPGARSSAAVRASNPWRSESAWIRLIACTEGRRLLQIDRWRGVRLLRLARRREVTYWLRTHQDLGTPVTRGRGSRTARRSDEGEREQESDTGKRHQARFTFFDLPSATAADSASRSARNCSRSI